MKVLLLAKEIENKKKIVDKFGIIGL